MKKYLLLTVALLGALVGKAQVLIVKTDSTRIEAKVTEVAPDAVRYKRFANPNGPTYVLPVGQISYIRYTDGFVERYTQPAAPEVAATPAVPTAPAAPAPVVAEQVAPAPAPVPAPTPAPTPAPQAENLTIQEQPLRPAPGYEGMIDYNYTKPQGEPVARYELGQYYNLNGVEGIVCLLNEERTHGLILSIDEVMLPWSTFKKDKMVEVGATNNTDGRENMATVARYIADHNGKWSDFPAFEWCRKKGEGWYLPSVDEMMMIGNNYNGGTRRHLDRKMRLLFNENLKLRGGDRIDNKCYYYTSTEIDHRLAMLTHMGLEAPYVLNLNSSEEVPKHSKFLVRAVHAF